jgi:hypothetical protein
VRVHKPVIDTASKNNRNMPSICKILLSKPSLSVQSDAQIGQCQLNTTCQKASLIWPEGAVSFIQCDFFSYKLQNSEQCGTCEMKGDEVGSACSTCDL